MDSNNQFGECCHCPALMQDSRIFTSYVPRRDYNAALMAKTHTKDSNRYREVLQENGGDILKVQHEMSKKRYECQGKQFYSTPDVNKFFDRKLMETLRKPPMD